MKIAVTGASGFIGSQLCKYLSDQNHTVNASFKSLKNITLKQKKNLNFFKLDDLSSNNDYTNFFFGVDCVIHCAAIAHIKKSEEKKNKNIYEKVNIEWTRNIAKFAQEAGVKRFIFLSSIGVNGVTTKPFQPFTHKDVPAPKGQYAISKFYAEKVLWEISKLTRLEVVIIRAPLVIGYGAKGNLSRLKKLINFRIPLPFGLVKNKKSFIGIQNLIEILLCCVDHPNVIGKTFLVSDDEDLSTPELILHISLALKRSSYLFPVPIFLLKFVSRIIGKQSELDQLLGSLQIDCSYTRETLNLKPSTSIIESIKNMVQEK